MVTKKQVKATTSVAVKYLEEIDRLAEAGLCAFSLSGARAFHEDIRLKVNSAISAHLQDIATTPTLAQLRSIIDKAEFWKGVADADDYNVAADHIATEIIDILARAEAPAKQEETGAN